MESLEENTAPFQDSFPYLTPALPQTVKQSPELPLSPWGGGRRDGTAVILQLRICCSSAHL